MIAVRHAIRETEMHKSLVLFIHGLKGAAAGTWEKFPDLVRQDAELGRKYDVAHFDYSTGIVGRCPALAIIAQSLKTEVEHRYADYGDIAIIAHSQGGLVARQYIADRINAGQRIPVRRLLTFGTPNQGSILANVMQHLPGTSRQVEALAFDSDFLLALAKAWGQARADTRVLTKYVVAADDRIVGPTSAMGPRWSPDYEVVSGVGHVALVKPTSPSHTSFLVAKRFLLEDPVLPGALEADYRPPLLHYKYVEHSEASRFVFGARVLPFVGRESELAKLTEFLADPEQPFRWMVLHGSGGVGKSRLALELCIAVGDEHEWHAGFLHQEAAEPDWGRWQPIVPTLIVIDYAARDTERTGRMMRALSGRGPADGTARLATPVRALLVERTDSGDWLDRVIGTGTTGHRVLAARARTNIQLATISDPWPLIEFVLKDAGKPLPEREKSLETLSSIDKERRPLFAHFMADALAAGRDVRQIDASRLLDDVIERWRDKFWRPAGAGAAEERTLALATMTGGLQVAEIANLKDVLLVRWDVDRHPEAFRAMTGQPAAEIIAPLEPDIVGEYFALECLARQNLADGDRVRLCDHAWHLEPFGMQRFSERAHRDFPKHAMLVYFRKLPAGRGQPQFAWAASGANLISNLYSHEPGAARALLEEMRAVAATHNEDLLWEHHRNAAKNLFYHLTLRQSSTPDDRATAQALLDVARVPVLVQVLAAAALGLFDRRARLGLFDRCQFHPNEWREMLDDVRTVAKVELTYLQLRDSIALGPEKEYLSRQNELLATPSRMDDLLVRPSARPITPLYLLDNHFRIVDWNTAFAIAFDRTMEGRKGRGVLEWTYFLDNYEEVLEHGVKMFGDANRLPAIDVEKIEYTSQRYGKLTAIKRAHQIPDDNGACLAWLVTLDVKFSDQERHDAFHHDLIRVLGLDLMWSEYAISYDRVLNSTRVYPELLEKMIGGYEGVARISEDARILDLGAGTGSLAHRLITTGRDRVIFALENNDFMLEVLRSKCQRFLRTDAESGGVIALKQYITSLYGLDDDYFDYVLLNVLYAAVDADACLKEAWRVLKPGGELRLTGPRKDTKVNVLFDRITEDLKEANKFAELQTDYRRVQQIAEEHLRPMLHRWSTQEVEQMILAAGFSKIVYSSEALFAGQGMFVCAVK
jgi:ubiquinone/menaquinone biosynthesis C-methylase UbiE